MCYVGYLRQEPAATLNSIITHSRHSHTRNKDDGLSIFTCPAHTMDIRQNRICSVAKWEHVRID